jgi:hypothetical protein
MVARAVSLYLKKGNEDAYFSLFKDRVENFLKYHVVTSDDMEKWQTPQAKKKVLGGMKYNFKSRNVYTVATAQSLLFFTE